MDDPSKCSRSLVLISSKFVNPLVEIRKNFIISQSSNMSISSSCLDIILVLSRLSEKKVSNKNSAEGDEWVN